MIDFDPFEQRLAVALRTDADRNIPRFEPASIARAVIQTDHTGQGRAVRMPRRIATMNRSTRFAAAAVIGVLAVGGALYLIRPGQPSIGSPSSTPGVSSSPSESASPSAVPSPTVVPARAPSWTTTGSMGTPRDGHTATLLPDGRVLATGGYDDGVSALASAELYDPDTRTWTSTGRMAFARGGHTATLLRDGQVLVAGCAVEPGGGGTVVASAELYDPASGTWTATGDMTEPRCLDFTATLLSDGRVLVAGGLDRDIVATAELYDPSTGTWTATASMTTPRYDHTATLLLDGTVLVAGGADHGGGGCCYLATAELYDPARGTWAATGNMGTLHGGDPATLLLDGTVLVAGFESFEVYDPAKGSWALAGVPAANPAGRGPLTLLPDARVLAVAPVVDGYAAVGMSTGLYDPGTGSWTAAGNGGAGRYAGYSVTLLRDGQVLVAGGISNAQDVVGRYLASADLYDPGTGR